MRGYYYQLLNGEEKFAYDSILKAILSNQPTVSMMFENHRESFKRVLRAVATEYPELFYVNFSNARYSTVEHFMKWNVEYIYDIEERQKIYKDLEEIVNRILAKMESQNISDDLGKCIFFHNQIVRVISYDQEAPDDPGNHLNAYNIVGTFIHKSAVCDGIAKAFKYLCDKSGIECIVVTGEACPPDESGQDEENHAWNIVRINGEYTHIDVTWDIRSSKYFRHFRYDYFGLPDVWQQLDHTFTGVPECTSFKLNHFYRRSTLIKSVKELKQYFKTALKNNDHMLYFRLCGNHIPDDIVDRVTDLLKRNIAEYMNINCTLIGLNNTDQNCFFFKIDEK